MRLVKRAVSQESPMNIVRGAARVVTRTADATTAAAGAGRRRDHRCHRWRGRDLFGNPQWPRQRQPFNFGRDLDTRCDRSCRPRRVAGTAGGRRHRARSAPIEQAIRWSAGLGLGHAPVRVRRQRWRQPTKVGPTQIRATQIRPAQVDIGSAQVDGSARRRRAKPAPPVVALPPVPPDSAAGRR